MAQRHASVRSTAHRGSSAAPPSPPCRLRRTQPRCRWDTPPARRAPGWPARQTCRAPSRAALALAAGGRACLCRLWQAAAQQPRVPRVQQGSAGGRAAARWPGWLHGAHSPPSPLSSQQGHRGQAGWLCHSLAVRHQRARLLRQRNARCRGLVLAVRLAGRAAVGRRRRCSNPHALPPRAGENRTGRGSLPCPQRTTPQRPVSYQAAAHQPRPGAPHQDFGVDRLEVGRAAGGRLVPLLLRLLLLLSRRLGCGRGGKGSKARWMFWRSGVVSQRSF